ncbi:MAG: hypothetical protein ACYSWQ_25795 [Planctomycetota bacterium]
MTETEPEIGQGIVQSKRKGLITRKRLCIVLGVALAGVVLPPVVVPFFKPWTQINCRHEDINIKTGQARYSRYLWFVKISEEIVDTPISVALGGEVIDVANIRPWHHVNTFSPGLRHSPHYSLHGALVQADQMEKVALLAQLGSDEKRDMAENILKLWQEGKGDFPADDYLQTVVEESTRISE